MSESDFFQTGDAPPVAHAPQARAAALIDAIRAHPFVKLMETRCKAGDDVVIVEFVVELPTDPAADIRATEPLAIVVGADELTVPTVLALRKDCPSPRRSP